MKNKFNKADFFRQREYAVVQAIQYTVALVDALWLEDSDRDVRRIATKAKACLTKLEQLRADIVNNAIEKETEQ